MGNPIVFGSPEARAILEKDKELQRIAEEDEPKGDANELAERLESLEFEIGELEIELMGLEEEADDIRAKLAEMDKPHPKPGFTALKKWNAWATGSMVAQ